MPWYYAGADAKPVGPIALDELQARRASGVISAETYIIEYVGAPDDARAWKRYKELFPSIPSLPPPPVILPAAIPPPRPPTVEAHPLFPSATALPGNPINPVPHGMPAMPRANPWCNWGFGLGLTSIILLVATCGLGVILAAPLAIPALVISIVGLLKVQHSNTQNGRNLAWSGVFLSGATLLIAIIILAIAIPLIIKGHGLITTTEQSTTDSE